MDKKTVDEEEPEGVVVVEETVENIDKYLRALAASSSSTNKQEKLLERLVNSEGLLEKYLKRSPECKEIFVYLDDTVEALNELSKSSVSLNVNETNSEILFTCLEKVLVYYQKKHKISLTTKKEDEPLLLAEKLDFKGKLTNICTTLLDKYMKLITKCLTMKSSTKKTLTLQETCVRLLTLCVQESAVFAKKIATDFEYFSVFKNWLERFLLMKQTDLREFSIQFLISYFKYTKVISSEKIKVDDITVDHEYLLLLKKIFLAKNSSPSSKSKKTSKSATKLPQTTTSSLIHCLFAHISTDSYETIEFLLQEFLFKFIKNESFNKSETIRIFNEKTLGHLIKLFEWADHRYKKSSGVAGVVDQTLAVRQMISEFLKVLFSSTKHGISFYDRTLNVDLSNKNFNHLIFNALISVTRPVVNESDKKQTRVLKEKTCEIIDDLVLKSLKVCPDLIQRYLKVKHKQETDQALDQSQEWFLKFCVRLFGQQLSVIKKMRKSLTGPSSFLRSLAGSFKNCEEIKTFLYDLIVHTSMPLCLSFQKILTQIFASKLSVQEKIDRYNQSLELLIASLSCVKEWQECLRCFLKEKKIADISDPVAVKVFDNLFKVFQSSGENFNSKLNLELLTKHLPKFDIFCDSDLINEILSDNAKETNTSNQAIINSFDVFSLYFDVFMTRNSSITNNQEAQLLDDEIDESDELIGSCFNFLQIETLEQNLVRLIPALLQLSSDNLLSVTTNKSSNSINLCLKYMKFLIRYMSLKHSEQCIEESGTNFDMNNIEFNSNLLFDSHLRIKSGDNSYLVDYKNLTLLNLVKIVFKFKEQALFKNLIGYFLKIFGVYLENIDSTEYTSDTFKYERNSMYLWLNLVRKHFIESSTLSSNELNLLIDYVYFCLNNILSANQRNFILFQINLNDSNNEQPNGFNELLTFVSIKNYQVFNDLITQNGMSMISLKKIQKFLFDFIFTSGFITENNIRKNSLVEILDARLTSKLLTRQQNCETVLEELKASLSSKLAEILKQCDKPECTAEVFMINFEKYSNLPSISTDKNFTVINLNLNLRISHLLFLTNLAANKIETFNIDSDLDLLINNLRNSLEQFNQLSKLSATDSISLSEEEGLFEKIDLNHHLDRVKSFCSSFKLDKESFRIQEKLNMDLVSEFNFDSKDSFEKLIDELSALNSANRDDETKMTEFERQFEFFAKVLVKNQDYLFEKKTSIFKEFDMDQKFVESLDTVSKCVNFLLSYISRCDMSKNLTEKRQGHLDTINFAKLKSQLVEFLLNAYAYKPTLFKLLVKVSCDNNSKALKHLKKFSTGNDKLTAIFEDSIESNRQTSKPTLPDISIDTELNEFVALNSVDERFRKELNVMSIQDLVKMYTYTLSKRDKAILKRLYKLDPKLDCLLFNSKKSSDGPSDNTENLDQQPKISDFITQKLNEASLLTACQNFPIDRKLEDLTITSDSKSTTQDNFDINTLVYSNSVLDAKIYDPIYVLPNIYNLLDYGNIVDIVQFVNTRCLSYLFSALSCECQNLRSLAYGSLYRFASHLENSRCFFKNIIVYLINLLRNSTDKENLHMPVVITVFLSEAVMIVKEPGTALYKPIISFLLLKPALDLTNVPEYYKLFNSSAINYKIERKWMLSILALSCRTSLDFRLFEKRFIYRQLLSIYDSRMSDNETKTTILNIVLRTCNCKYALIELIKRHYLLVWLSNSMEGNLANSRNSEVNMEVFYKQIQIFILIWRQLGANRLIKNGETEEVVPPPLTFLNQMLILMKYILDKLILNHDRLNDLKLEFGDNPNTEKLLIDLGKLVIKNFFKVKKELIESIQKYNLNLVKLESNENMDNELETLRNCDNTTVRFEDVSAIIEKRKLLCQNLFNTNKNKLEWPPAKKIKIQT